MNSKKKNKQTNKHMTLEKSLCKAISARVFPGCPDAMATNLVISQNVYLLLRPAVKLPHVRVSGWKSNPSCWQKSCGLPDSLSPSSTGSLEMNCATGKCTWADSTGQSHCTAFSMCTLLDLILNMQYFLYRV